MPTPSRTKSRGTQWQTLGNGAAAEEAGHRPKRHKPEPAKVRAQRALPPVRPQRGRASRQSAQKACLLSERTEGRASCPQRRRSIVRG